MKVVLISIILLTSVCIYAQTDDKETLKNLNQSVVSSYKKGDFSEAKKFAQQVLDLTVKVFGNESFEAAAAHSNLGIILRESKDYKESVVNLKRAVEIYQKMPASKNQRLSDAIETLAFSQTLSGEKQEAEVNYLLAVETAEKQFGKGSKESFSPILNTANFFAQSKNFERADEFYLKSYEVAAKAYGKQGKEFEEIENSRACLTTPPGNVNNQKQFAEERKKIIGENPEQGGIINAKTKYLPPPKYPSEARKQRLGGRIPMRVKIDEKGNVIEVKTICGSPALLAAASEEAVRGAKFEIVEIAGKPIKYSGIVFYNFVP